jgi:hypothetical protein
MRLLYILELISRLTLLIYYTVGGSQAPDPGAYEE